MQCVATLYARSRWVSLSVSVGAVRLGHAPGASHVGRITDWTRRAHPAADAEFRDTLRPETASESRDNAEAVVLTADRSASERCLRPLRVSLSEYWMCALLFEHIYISQEIECE